MHSYIIYSTDKRKAAELAPEQGGVRFSLSEEGVVIPVFSGYLHDMLTFSEGKPWRVENVQLDSVRITQEEGETGGILRLQAVLKDRLAFSMKLAFDENQLLRLEAVWNNLAEGMLTDLAVGLLFRLPKRGSEIVTIPHMIYNNNPSSDPSRIVPRLGVGPHRGSIFEEHRLPVPCVNVEWKEPEHEGGSRYISLFSLPCYEESAEGKVHYGSLGAIEEETSTTAVALSGAVMLNGEKDVICIAKSTTSSYAGGYVSLAPGAALTKSYAIDMGGPERSGRAFREIVRQGLRLYRPEGAKPLTLDEMIRLKTNALDDRWRAGANGEAGYVKFSDSNGFGNVSKHPPHYMYGWTGQCLKLAWCDAKLGFRLGEQARLARSKQAVNFYVEESLGETAGLRRGIYYMEEGRWEYFRSNKQPVVSSRAMGETLTDLADMVLLYRGQGLEVPAGWIEAIQTSADFLLSGLLPSGVYPAAWQPDGSPADEMITAAGLPCVMALAKAFQVTGVRGYLEAAESAMSQYYLQHALTFERPFARSTLDARCEDKEAGMYFFQAALELYETTARTDYLVWAELAADWLLTFVFMWSPVYDRGTAFREADFRAAGWPGVSVQNHHLDVFFPTYALWRLGRLTGNSDYERMGRLSFDAMGQGICTEPGEWGFDVIGEQAEGLFQTNWNHRGHCNRWNPSWVVALVLQNALRFREEVSV
ncbi:hypothetical protein [Paenibacillus puerhi]|uniref:hypothetical protein n=1 Tax=Paenibacillus puerhi TaxID=2692622 RepID=UPI00135C14DF|nr:hypothetical protein [Paenibacillus puerhi]